MELALLIGLPASGKSTFYRRRLAWTHARASGSAARFVEAAFREDRSVVVDAANATAAGRRRLLAKAKARHARAIGYYFPPNVLASLALSPLRAAAIRRVARRFEPPSREEGFDELFEVRRSGSEFELVEASPNGVRP